MARQYDVKRVSAIISTTDGETYDITERHEEGIKDSPASEKSSEAIASNGVRVVNITPDDSTEVEISLMYGSAEQKIFERLYAKWKARTGEYLLTLVVRDENNKETTRYENGVFEQRSTHEWGHETGTNARTWKLKFERVSVDFD